MPGSLNIASMTGYGRGSAAGMAYRVSVDIRTVNSRFLELRPRLPRYMLSLESFLREQVSENLRRGVVDIGVNVQALSGQVNAATNADMAAAYAREIEGLSKKLSIPSGLTGLALVSLPGVLMEERVFSAEEEQELAHLLKRALAEALEGLLGMRRAEGDKLRNVLQRELEEIRKHRQWIAEHRDDLNKKYFSKLQSRIREWTDKAQISLDDSRLYQEVAFHMDRSDIAEELDRLASHLKQWDETLARPNHKSIGKRLDFLAQEIGREINTIGSKSDQVIVTNHVMDMKLCLERMREQVQNIE